MRTVLNILNFVLGGFFTTLGWLIATVFSVLLIFTLPLTRSCWEITKLSFLLSAMRRSTSMNFTRKKAMRCFPPAARC
ncbi:Inner membrane protein yccF [Serratia ficaria]|nr:Inner membrane protein yccF [Serratia ficaria]